MLLLQAKPGNPEVCSAAQGADDSNSMQAAVAAALRQTKLQDVQDACGDITNTRAAAAGNRSSSSDSRSSDGWGPDIDVGPLLELCPAGISGQFVQHCLQSTLQGDVQVRSSG